MTNLPPGVTDAMIDAQMDDREFCTECGRRIEQDEECECWRPTGREDY